MFFTQTLLKHPVDRPAFGVSNSGDYRFFRLLAI